MNKVITLYLSLLASILILASCSTQSSLYGLWQDTTEKGSIEFKKNGDVIIVDNMSATATGSFKEEDQLINFELTATDIMKESIQPITKTMVTAKIIKLDKNELQLSFSGQSKIEHYKRIQ